MKKRMFLLLTMSILTTSALSGCGKEKTSPEPTPTETEISLLNNSEQELDRVDIEMPDNAESLNNTEMSTESDAIPEDLVTEDQLVEGTYSNPASIGEWVDVASGYHDTEIITHGGSAVNNESYAHIYYRVTEVCDNSTSTQLLNDYNNISDIGGLTSMDEDNKGLQWTAVKYEIYVPYSFSDCNTCKPYLGMTIDSYAGMDEENYDMTKDLALPDSQEMAGGIPSGEYELQKGSYYSGYIFYKTQIGVEKDYTLAVYPYNLTLLKERLIHDENDPGKYFTIHVMSN